MVELSHAETMRDDWGSYSQNLIDTNDSIYQQLDSLQAENEQLKAQIQLLGTSAIADGIELVDENVAVQPVEPLAIAAQSDSNSQGRTDIFSASDLAKQFPDLGAKSNPAQVFRDWGKAALNGGMTGKNELAKIGFEAINEVVKGKTTYRFRRISSNLQLAEITTE